MLLNTWPPFAEDLRGTSLLAKILSPMCDSLPALSLQYRLSSLSCLSLETIADFINEEEDDD